MLRTHPLIVTLLLGLLPLPMARAEAAAPQEETAMPANANNAFAFDLYARLSQAKSGNLFFSPYSIDTALAMTLAGAKGETADQMTRVLHLQDAKAADAQQKLGALVKEINASGKEDDQVVFQLVVANALWAQHGYPFLPDYRKRVADTYGAQLAEVDYMGAPDAAQKQINDWVAHQTNDKITDLVPRSAISNLTRLILTNAVYFKSQWMQQFNKTQTRDEPFHSAGGTSANVPMMHQQHSFNYVEDDDLQAIELPYLLNRLSMIVLLPKKADGLGALEKSLSADRLAKLTAAMKGQPVVLALPRFKMTSEFSLGKTLGEMGMTDAFDVQKANFTGMTTAERLSISDAIHKAYVDVNEEGTEAAAATAMAMRGAALRHQEPVRFTADHPFVFLIRHRASGAILFAGRVADPAAGNN